jgi:hypothetical protein
MSILPLQLDADPRLELLYAWEGYGPTSGGVGVLDFVGSDLLDATHWQDRQVVSLPGAYHLALAPFPDFRGVAVAVRQHANPSAVGGVTLTEISAAATWITYTLMASGDYTKVDFHADGSLLANDKDAGPRRYQLVGGWLRHYAAPVGFVQAGESYNLKALPDGSFINVRQSGAWWLYRWDGTAYTPRWLMPTGKHPADNQMLWVTLDGLPSPVLIAGDSSNYGVKGGGVVIVAIRP